MVVVLLVCGLTIAYLTGMFSSQERLVVYCSHDLVYSEKILRDFERQTGITVSIIPDSEATKSLGLVNRIIREKDHPRCDVFWNNQVLGTMDLKQHGLLHPYKGSGFKRIPEKFKDRDGHWVGFAGRLRVWIVNTDKMTATPEAIDKALQGDLSRMAIAKPLYGTTLSHYSLLWHRWGAERLKKWHHDVRRRGAKEVSGNATAKNHVAEGTCDFGWTDTDDFFVAQDDSKPVAMLPIRLEDNSTICIPNSVAIIRGTKKLSAAQKLVDFLLSAETELALARSKSRYAIRLRHRSLDRLRRGPHLNVEVAGL